MFGGMSSFVQLVLWTFWKYTLTEYWVFCCAFILHMPKGCFCVPPLFASPTFKPKLQDNLKSNCGAHSHWCLWLLSHSVGESAGWIKPKRHSLRLCKSDIIIACVVVNYSQSCAPQVIYALWSFCCMSMISDVRETVGKKRGKERGRKGRGGDRGKKRKKKWASCKLCE